MALANEIGVAHKIQSLRPRTSYWMAWQDRSFRDERLYFEPADLLDEHLSAWQALGCSSNSW
ncbi:MAG UNVERIFIED_CONTAM: hypothetical protein LVT10_18495 [Anaerolineae bacterium]